MSSQVIQVCGLCPATAPGALETPDLAPGEDWRSYWFIKACGEDREEIYRGTRETLPEIKGRQSAPRRGQGSLEMGKRLHSAAQAQRI